MNQSFQASVVRHEAESPDADWFVSFRRLSPRNRRHLHGAVELLYLFSGKRTFHLDDRQVDLVPGYLLVINSNVMHKAINPLDRDSEGVLIHIHDYPQRYEEAEPPSEKNGYRGVMKFRDIGSRRTTVFHRSVIDAFPSLFSASYRLVAFDQASRNLLESTLRSMKQEITDGAEGRDFAIRTHIQSVLLQAGRGMDSRKAAFPVEQSADSRLAGVLQYIRSHFMENLSLDTVAGAFQLSPAYFSRMFRQASGFSFVEYVNTVRVREAIRMIRTEEFNMSYIAEQVGFGSVSHFGRVFRQITGRRPSQYREHRS